MHRDDAHAVRDLLREGLDVGGAIVQDTHRAIAARTFGALGQAGAPVRAVHDGISTAVYGGVRAALRGAAHHGGTALAQRARPGTPRLRDRPRGRIAVGALNGLYGDHLQQRGSPLALELGLRRHGRDVPMTPASLAAAYPDASPRIAVFLHGLGETEDAWRGVRLTSGARTEPRVPFGARLQDDLDFTPVYVRFNSGLHISDNGRVLDALLASLAEHWPVAAAEFVLIGHSMGGLVARSACHQGGERDARWAQLVRHVFCLGSPHLGADLEKGVHGLSWALARVPESRAIGGLLRSRSAGIKDLRFGSCAEDDWRDLDLDAFFTDRCAEVPFLPDAQYYFVGATLADGPLGHALGDLLVRIPSASGKGKHRVVPFPEHNGHTLAGLTHFDLLDHPAVYEQLRRWISGAPVAA